MNDDIPGLRARLKELVSQVLAGWDERPDGDEGDAAEASLEAVALSPGEAQELLAVIGRLCQLTENHPRPDFDLFLLMMALAARRAAGPSDAALTSGLTVEQWRRLYDAAFLFFYRKTFTQAVLHFVKKGWRQGNMDAVIQETYGKIHEKIGKIEKVLPVFWTALKRKYLDDVKATNRHRRKMDALRRARQAGTPLANRGTEDNDE